MYRKTNMLSKKLVRISIFTHNQFMIFNLTFTITLYSYIRSPVLRMYFNTWKCVLRRVKKKKKHTQKRLHSVKVYGSLRCTISWYNEATAEFDTSKRHEDELKKKQKYWQHSVNVNKKNQILMELHIN